MTKRRRPKKRATKSEGLKGNWLDRSIAFFSPDAGARRMRSRAVMEIANSAYHAASKKRRAVAGWDPAGGDADTDVLDELQDLREKSRDAIRNVPIAGGAINTKVTNVVGPGLALQARIDRDILGMAEDEATAWERRTEAEWRLFSESVNCDAARGLNFAGIQDLAFRSVLGDGDTFCLTPYGVRPGSPYGLQMQLIEADRCVNEGNVDDTDTLAGGVKKKESGEPIEYHFLKTHPGNLFSIKSKDEWIKVRAFGPKTGRRNVIHLYRKIRIGQTRGIPDLAPVLELLKQMGRYTDSEVQAAVVSSFFTVFIKQDQPNAGGLPALQPVQPTANVGGKTSDKDFKMASGAILELGLGEDVEVANPGRPNQGFDAFIVALCRQIGVALELPYEILVKHFTASYSAARAAIEEAWRFYLTRRSWLADYLCRPVYELFLVEAVGLGRIYAPGFLNGDPLIRKAYLGSDWIGPAKPQIDEKKSVDAAEKRMETGITTLAQETVAFNGGDWDRNHVQRAKEVKRRKEDGLESVKKPKGEEDGQVVSDPDEGGDAEES